MDTNVAYLKLIFSFLLAASAVSDMQFRRRYPLICASQTRIEQAKSNKQMAMAISWN